MELRARVNGYVERVLVDRGSFVKKGQVLAELTAPEMQAQVAEATSRAQSAASQRTEAQARLAAAQSTYDRLKAASETPGAIAGNELDAGRTEDGSGQSRGNGCRGIGTSRLTPLWMR